MVAREKAGSFGVSRAGNADSATSHSAPLLRCSVTPLHPLRSPPTVLYGYEPSDVTL